MRALLSRVAAVACALWLAIGATCAPAADMPFAFADAAEAARFKALATQLRCLVCQNQSIEDSHAPLAQDLRKEVLRLMREGRSDADIEAFLTERYGDFVLYAPRVTPVNYLLWFGPPLLLLGALAWAARRWRAVRAADAAALSDDERARALALLQAQSESNGASATAPDAAVSKRRPRAQRADAVAGTARARETRP